VYSRRPAMIWRSSIRCAAALFAAAALAVTLAAPCAEGSFPGTNGVIAYSAENSIWVVDPTTGHQARLISGGDDSAPSFSPSGNLLAFERTTPKPGGTAGAGAATIYLANADGSNPRPLVAGNEPAFSPSGRQIVFARPSGLFLIGIQPGARVRRLTDHRGDLTPRWSATGWIAFQRIEGDHSDLDLIHPPSRRIRLLVSHKPDIGSPRPMWPEWSPSGKTISVALCEFGDEIARLPTVPLVVLHSTCAPDVWAPAGKRLLEAGTGPLVGRPETSCPPYIAGGGSEDVSYFHHGNLLYGDEGPNWPIAWQPLKAGGSPVPTTECEAQPQRENGATEGVAPATVTRGGRLCAYRRRHRRLCHAT
jgi:hypothetical protein